MAVYSQKLFEIVFEKKCWPIEECDDTGWIRKLESLTFNRSDWSIAEFNDEFWISEPGSFAFNGNSNRTGFSCFGLYLLNNNLVCVFLIPAVDFFGEWNSLFWVFWEFELTCFTFFPFLIQIEAFSFKSRLSLAWKIMGT